MMSVFQKKSSPTGFFSSSCIINDHEVDTLTPVKFSGLTQRPNPIAEKIFNVSLILSASDPFVEVVSCIFQTCLDNPFKE